MAPKRREIAVLGIRDHVNRQQLTVLTSKSQVGVPSGDGYNDTDRRAVLGRAGLCYDQKEKDGRPTGSSHGRAARALPGTR